jgi:hypothetical protein
VDGAGPILRFGFVFGISWKVLEWRPLRGDGLHCRFRAANGKEGLLAKPSFTSRPPHKHGLRLPDSPRPERGAPELAIC